MRLPQGAWTVLAKEIRETMRDRNLIVNLVLVPLFLYPLLGFGALQIVQIVKGVSEKSPPLVLVSPQTPPELRDSLLARDDLDVEVEVRSPGMMRAATLREAGADSARAWWHRLHRSPAAVLDWGRTSADSALLVYDASRDRSRAAHTAVLEEWNEWSRNAVLERARTHGLTAADVQPWSVVNEDTASASERGQEILAMVLPLTLLLMLTMGTYYSALDAVVGERERGTLETLFVTPLSRGAILAGKLMYVVLASITSLVLNLVSLTLFLGLVLRVAPTDSEIRVNVEPAAFLLVVLAAFLAAAFFAAIFMMASVRSKSYREGQAALLPYFMGTLVVAVSASATRSSFTMKEAVVPVVNVLSLFKSVLRGEYPLMPILTAFGVLALLALAALEVARRVGARETRA